MLWEYMLQCMVWAGKTNKIWREDKTMVYRCRISSCGKLMGYCKLFRSEKQKMIIKLFMKFNCQLKKNGKMKNE